MKQSRENKEVQETKQSTSSHNEQTSQNLPSSFEDNRPSTKKSIQLKKSIDESTVRQKKENKTGLPDNLKSGIENLSGVDISDTKVHYNSSDPEKVGAHAYAQGKDIHVASGQEKHVAHEAWHIVQQKQGRVKPTKNVNGVPINDNAGLEKEADVMGEKALQSKTDPNKTVVKANNAAAIQRRKKAPAETKKTENLSRSHEGGVKASKPKLERKKAPEKKEETKDPSTPQESFGDHPLIKMKDSLKATDYKALLAAKKDDPKAKEGMSMGDKMKVAMAEKKDEGKSKANRASRVAKDKAKKTAKSIKGLVQKLKKKFSSGSKDVEKVEKKNKKTSQPGDKLKTAKTALSTTKSIISGIKSISEKLKAHSSIMNAVSEVPGVGAVISGISLAVSSIEVYETYKEQKEQEIAKLAKYDGNKILDGFKGQTPDAAAKKIKGKLDSSSDPVAKKTFMQKILQIKEFILDEELLVIAKKRFKRKVYDTATMFVAFIGRIAELFPGVGSLIGKIMGGVSKAMKAGAAAVRGIKQFGRDHGIAGFDSSKNSSAKQNKRVSLTGTMLNMVVSLPEYNQENEKEYTKVENYFKKSGCNTDELYLHTGHTGEQIDYILESLKKRS